MPWNHSPRRSFLAALGSLPLVGGLVPASLAVAAPKAAGPKVLEGLGVEPLINAAGTYTALTASLMPPEVMEAINDASKHFYRLNDLHDAIGKRLAERLQAEAALVSAGCASALSLATAACITGDDRDKISRLPDTHDMKNEVIIQKSHRNGYDHAIRNCGVRMVEVETVQELERAINHRTAMMVFFNKSDPDGQIKVGEFAALGKKHGIPTLNDAAADVPPVDNLFRFQKMGYDLVAFSGGKGLRGPQSAGLLLGRKDLIAAARMNDSPNGDAVCRTNKVNKEEMVGMLAAVERFLDLNHDAEWKMWEARCETVARAVRKIKGVKTEVYVPHIANAVPHLRVVWDYDKAGKKPSDVRAAMRERGIELTPGGDDSLTVGVWMLQDGEDAIVAKELASVLG